MTILGMFYWLIPHDWVSNSMCRTEPTNSRPNAGRQAEERSPKSQVGCRTWHAVFEAFRSRGGYQVTIHSENPHGVCFPTVVNTVSNGWMDCLVGRATVHAGKPGAEVITQEGQVELSSLVTQGDYEFDHFSFEEDEIQGW